MEKIRSISVSDNSTEIFQDTYTAISSFEESGCAGLSTSQMSAGPTKAELTSHPGVKTNLNITHTVGPVCLT